MPATAITIGNFDGVHIGHAALVRRARELAGPEGRVVVISFDPHPATILRAERTPPRLTTFARREGLLRAAGADVVEKLEPTPEILAMTAEEFVRDLVKRYAPAWIVEGPDFRFGKGRSGTLELLRSLGAASGYTLHVEPSVTLGLHDHLIAPASSSLTRWLLANARVADAALVLGRPHRLEGVVVKGDQRGRTIGFPTANLDSEVMPPADGVYAAVATLPDGRPFPAALNIGTRPTFRGVDRRVEAHLLGATEMPEYGWRLSLDIAAFVRDQVRFDSVQRLADQLRCDCDRAAVMLASHLTLCATEPLVCR
ncbi:MAG: riboflavin biosynthesis protein RibF [Phycisphaerae bacterium]|nr:riboflavin biosynthesis protein RibF [Phycisphaerae bacterium]